MTNQITVNVSALTDRVDILQQSVTGLQMELQQIRNTIPVSLPEFTDPVPVTINNPTAPIDLSGLLTELAAIKTILENQNVPPISSEPESMLEPYSLASSTISLVGNWNVEVPSGLSNIIDGNPQTSATWGRIENIGNQAGVQLLLPVVDRFYAEIEFGIAMVSSHPDGEGEWRITTGLSSFTFPVAGGRLKPSASERRFVIPVWLYGNTIQVNTIDFGGGRVRLKVYNITVWRYGVPV